MWSLSTLLWVLCGRDNNPVKLSSTSPKESAQQRKQLTLLGGILTSIGIWRVFNQYNALQSPLWAPPVTLKPRFFHDLLCDDEEKLNVEVIRFFSGRAFPGRGSLDVAVRSNSKTRNDQNSRIEDQHCHLPEAHAGIGGSVENNPDKRTDAPIQSLPRGAKYRSRMPSTAPFIHMRFSMWLFM